MTYTSILRLNAPKKYHTLQQKRNVQDFQKYSLTRKQNCDRLLKNSGEQKNAELTFYNESYVPVLQTYLDVIVFRLDAQLRR